MEFISQKQSEKVKCCMFAFIIHIDLSYSRSGIEEIRAPILFMSCKKFGYDTSTDSAPATIDFCVSIEAMVNAMNNL